MALRSNREGAGEMQKNFSVEVTCEDRNRGSKDTEARSSIVNYSNIRGKETQSQVASGETEKGDGFLMTLLAI